jgi:hypothetical protein
MNFTVADPSPTRFGAAGRCSTTPRGARTLKGRRQKSKSWSSGWTIR